MVLHQYILEILNRLSPKKINKHIYDFPDIQNIGMLDGPFVISMWSDIRLDLAVGFIENESLNGLFFFDGQEAMSMDKKLQKSYLDSQNKPNPWLGLPIIYFPFNNNNYPLNIPLNFNRYKCILSLKSYKLIESKKCNLFKSYRDSILLGNLDIKEFIDEAVFGINEDILPDLSLIIKSYKYENFQAILKNYKL